MSDDLDTDTLNKLVAGGVFAVLLTPTHIDVDPQLVTDDDGQATNALTVKLGHMKSRYRLTVERVDDEADGS